MSTTFSITATHEPNLQNGGHTLRASHEGRLLGTADLAPANFPLHKNAPAGCTHVLRALAFDKAATGIQREVSLKFFEIANQLTDGAWLPGFSRRGRGREPISTREQGRTLYRERPVKA